MMREELADLRHHIQHGQQTEALAIVDELDDMSRKAIVRNIRSFLVRLLTHQIKNQVEKRLTNSWAASIRSSIREIQDLNQQENKRTYYVQPEDLPGLIDDAFEDAIYEAAAEVFGGASHPLELMATVDREQVCGQARTMLADTYTCTRQELSARINEHLASLPGGEAWQTGREQHSP
jgi:hypothetical protein